MTPGPFQILIILALVLFFFGAKRVPGIAENLAKGIKSFKKGLKEDDEPVAIEKRQDDDE